MTKDIKRTCFSQLVLVGKLQLVVLLLMGDVSAARTATVRFADFQHLNNNIRSVESYLRPNTISFNLFGPVNSTVTVTLVHEKYIKPYTLKNIPITEPIEVQIGEDGRGPLTTVLVTPEFQRELCMRYSWEEGFDSLDVRVRPYSQIKGDSQIGKLVGEWIWIKRGDCESILYGDSMENE